VSVRISLDMRGDPMLKNELLGGAKSALFARKPLLAAQMFLRSLKDEDEQWKRTAVLMGRSLRNQGVEPIATPCQVHWTHLRAKDDRIDTAAIAMPTWSILDGLVRAKLLLDDDRRFVVRQTYSVQVVGWEGIRVVLESEPGASLQEELEV
jgi:hypothetical protein